MLKFFNASNGMNIIGQGRFIMMFALPSLIAAIFLHVKFPHFAHLPIQENVSFIAGIIFFLFGFSLWLTALIQLLRDFPKGKLVTSGAYGICRNPLYGSVAFFILPSITFFTNTWVYLIVSFFIYLGASIFLPKEEKVLEKVFGEEYKNYSIKVNRFIPFFKFTK